MSQRDLVRIPSLSGGISKQPAQNRFPDQVEDATNVRFSVEDGASKRAGTEFVTEFTSPGFGTGAAAKLHTIERDSDEQYICVYGPNQAGSAFVLKVYDTDGNAATVNGYSGDAQTYLETDIANASADDYRFVTVADTTIVVNKRAAVGMETSATYDVAHTVRDYAALLSFTPDNDEYVRTQGDDASEVAGYWQYTPEDDLEYAKIRFPIVTGDWARPRGYWDDTATGAPGGFRIGQSRDLLTGFTAATWTQSSRTLTKTGAFSSYTYRPGDMIYISAGTGWTVGWYLIESKTDANNIVLAPDSKQAAGTLPADNSDTASNDSDSKARIGNEANVEFDFNADPQNSMYDIAAEIQSALRTAGWENGLVAWVPKGGGGYFEITGSFRGSNARVYAPSAPSGASTKDLTDASGEPFYATNAVTTNGSGTIGTAEATQPVAWRWTRVAAPGQTNATFSPEKMPVKLTRTSTSPLTFEWATIDWEDRLVGDDVTNPAPKPFKESATTSAYITDATYFEGRLVLAVGEYVIFSESDNLFNFFLDDDSQVVDTDRISKPLGTNKIANIDYLVPYQKTILVLTEAGQQYEVGYTDALTPSGTTITETTQYRTASLRPVTLGPFAYFATNRDDDTAIWEYFYDESTGANLASEITKHVRGFLPTGLRSIVADSVQEALVCLKLDERCLYVYRTHWQGNQKVLAAWSKYQFDSTYEVRDIATLGGNIYILYETSYEWALDRVPLSPQPTPTDFQYPVHLDRQQRIANADMSLSGSDTEIDLGTLDARGSTYNLYIQEDGTQGKNTGGTWKYGLAQGASSNNHILIPDVDLVSGGEDIYLGRWFTTSVELTRPYRRDEKGRAVASERLVVHNVWVFHEDSGDYTVTRSDPDSVWANATTTFTPTATTEDGYTRVPVRNDADTETVTISDTNAKPLNISTVEWEVEAMQGVRRN